MTRKAKAPFGLPGIFDNVRDGLILVRFPQREIVLFNRAASDLTGLAIEDAMSSRLDRIFADPAVHGTAQECSGQAVGVWPGHDQKMILTNVEGSGERRVELHFCRVDDVGLGGPLVLVVMRPSPELADEVAQAGRRAKSRVEELEEEARQRALLFSTAAHEFNTPLAIVALQAELLHDVLGPVMPVQAKALTIINANVHRLVLLSQDLMDLARADAGRLVLAMDRLDFGGLVRTEATGFEALATQQGLALSVVVPGPAPVQGDAGRLRQVLANFIGNAIKFTPPGGTVTILVNGTMGHGVGLQVTDTGPGMDAADLARIFRPFVRIDSPQAPHKPGTGLGLYLSKRIVEAHGGAVGCSSPGRGQGMTFWLRLPKAVAPDAAAPAQALAGARPAARPKKAGKPAAHAQKAAAAPTGAGGRRPPSAGRPKA